MRREEYETFLIFGFRLEKFVLQRCRILHSSPAWKWLLTNGRTFLRKVLSSASAMRMNAVTMTCWSINNSAIGWKWFPSRPSRAAEQQCSGHRVDAQRGSVHFNFGFLRQRRKGQSTFTKKIILYYYIWYYYIDCLICFYTKLYLQDKKKNICSKLHKCTKKIVLKPLILITSFAATPFACCQRSVSSNNHGSNCVCDRMSCQTQAFETAAQQILNFKLNLGVAAPQGVAWNRNGVTWNV